jgi:hypothetical protein
MKIRVKLSPLVVLLALQLSVLSTSVFARDVVRYDLPTISAACKVVSYFSADYDISKDTGVKRNWSGRCAGGYLQGSGVLTNTYPNGTISITNANFVNGMEQGPGSVNTEGVDFKKSFLGTFKDGWTAYGTQTYENFRTGEKTIYEGTFWNGEKSGDGSLLAQTRTYKMKYVGKFLNDMPNGWGTQTIYARSPEDNDYTWTGNFVNYKKNGTGRYSTNKGHYGTEQWVNDGPVDDRPDPPVQLSPQQLREIFPPQQKIVPFNCTTYRGTTSCQ